MKPSLMRRAADADVCLLLEGTFPYARGGVSSWVNEMLRSYPEIRFAIAFIGSRELPVIMRCGGTVRCTSVFRIAA